jgi:hypothetical protein
MLSFMVYFLEYVTDEGAGKFIVGGIDTGEAVAKAKGALRGLDCNSAALRHTPDPEAAFGDGSVVAVYTRDQGWWIQEARPM